MLLTTVDCLDTSMTAQRNSSHRNTITYDLTQTKPLAYQSLYLKVNPGNVFFFLFAQFQVCSTSTEYFVCVCVRHREGKPQGNRKRDSITISKIMNAEEKKRSTSASLGCQTPKTLGSAPGLQTATFQTNSAPSSVPRLALKRASLALSSRHKSQKQQQRRSRRRRFKWMPFCEKAFASCLRHGTFEARTAASWRALGPLACTRLLSFFFFLLSSYSNKQSQGTVDRKESFANTETYVEELSKFIPACSLYASGKYSLLHFGSFEEGSWGVN